MFKGSLRLTDQSEISGSRTVRRVVTLFIFRKQIHVHKHQFGHLSNGNKTFILPLWRGVQQVRFVALHLGKAVPKSERAEPTSCCPPY